MDAKQGFRQAGALRRDIQRKLRQVGVLETLRHGMRRVGASLAGHPSANDVALGDPFDATYGTDTAEIVSVGALDIDDGQLAHSNRYEAVTPAAFEEIMTRLPVEHARFTFVDIGSGKGRALLLASRFPFQRIVGVELSAALTRIADSNIRRFRDARQRCSAIEAVCADGGSYEPPPGAVVIYLNNPFDAHVMRPLIATLERRLTQGLHADGELWVIYQRPLHRTLFDASAAFELVHTAERFLIYRGCTRARPII